MASRPTPTETELNELFNVYSDSKRQGIEPEQILKLCKDLEVEPTDVTLLLLAYALKTKKLLYFSKSEWMEGMKRMRIPNLLALKEHLQKMKKAYPKMSAKALDDFYGFVFDYQLEEGKVLDRDTVIVTLKTVLPNKPHIDHFCNFLKDTNVKGLNRDQWDMLHEFSKTIDPDLSNYDETASWPTIFDSFVQYMTERQ